MFRQVINSSLLDCSDCVVLKTKKNDPSSFKKAEMVLHFFLNYFNVLKKLDNNMEYFLFILDIDGNNLALSSKYSLIKLAEELPSDISQLQPNSVVHVSNCVFECCSKKKIVSLKYNSRFLFVCLVTFF